MTLEWKISNDNAPTEWIGWKPTPLQMHLLKAALLKGEVVSQSWDIWRAASNIDRVDTATFRLFPLLYRNLERHHIVTPEVPKLRGVYKHTWANNQMHLHPLKAMITVLEAQGIPTLVLKGLALAFGYYHDLGLRATGDADLLVPLANRDRALQALEAHGWRMKIPMPPAHLDVIHANALVNAAGKEIDLHWHISREGLYVGADDDFWAAAIPLWLDEIETRALCPTDQLLHILMHGSRWDPVPPFRWVADAFTVIGAGRVEWDRFIAQAKKRHITRLCSEMLEYLGETFGAPVPKGVVQTLRAHRAPLWERFEYAARIRQRRVWHGLLYHPMIYGRMMLDGHHSLFAFPAYLRDSLHIDSLWRLPIYSVRILARDLLRAARGESADSPSR